MAGAKYKEWIEDKDKRVLLSGWARNGLSDEQIATNIGISRSTLNVWKKKYTDISDALKKGKEISDMEVENALFKRSLGYTVEVKKNFKCKEIKYNRDGKKIKEIETLVVACDEIHIPPDTGAIIFWLKNRMPDIWKDRRESKDGSEENGIVMMAPVDFKAAELAMKKYMEKEAEENK